MDPVTIGLLGASAISGLFGKKKRTTTETSSSRRVLDPAFGPLQQQILQRTMARLNRGTALPAGYAEAGAADINRTFDSGRQSLENILTSRGLSDSPVAGAVLGRHEGTRLGNVGRFRLSLPLLERDMENEDLGLASGILGMGYTGTETTGKATGDSDRDPVGDLAGMLGFLYGQGAFQRKPRTSSFFSPYMGF